MVIQDQKQKEVLFTVCAQQRKIVETSALFVILGDTEANKSVEAVYLPLVEKQAMTEAAYEKLQYNINQVYKVSSAKAREQAFLNASLFSMQLMLAAKAKGYDTSPIGGFDAEQLAQTLHIPERFVPVMIIAVGKAQLPARLTSRLQLEDIIIYESFKENNSDSQYTEEEKRTCE